MMGIILYVLNQQLLSPRLSQSTQVTQHEEAGKTCSVTGDGEGERAVGPQTLGLY